MADGFQTPEYPSPAGSAIAQFLNNFGQTMANARQSELEMAWKKYQMDKGQAEDIESKAQQEISSMTPGYEPVFAETEEKELVPAGYAKTRGIKSWKKLPKEAGTFQEKLEAKGILGRSEYQSAISRIRTDATKRAYTPYGVAVNYVGDLIGIEKMKPGDIQKAEKSREEYFLEGIKKEGLPKPEDYGTYFKNAVEGLKKEQVSSVDTLEQEFPEDLKGAREQIKKGMPEWKAIVTLEAKYGKRDWLPLLVGVQK